MKKIVVVLTSIFVLFISGCSSTQVQNESVKSETKQVKEVLEVKQLNVTDPKNVARIEVGQNLIVAAIMKGYEAFSSPPAIPEPILLVCKDSVDPVHSQIFTGEYGIKYKTFEIASGGKYGLVVFGYSDQIGDYTKTKRFILDVMPKSGKTYTINFEKSNNTINGMTEMIPVINEN